MRFAKYLASANRRIGRFWRAAVLLGGLCAAVAATQQAACHAHHGLTAREVTFSARASTVAGTLLLPEADGRVPCLVVIGGTLSQDRDGRLFREGVPRRDALKRLAAALAVGGYATLRYDKVGFGGSRPGSGWRGTYADEAAVAAAAIEFARKQLQIGQVVVVGESAGGYVACLAAKGGAQADGYVFLGALCGSSEAMYAFTFGGLARWAESSPTRLDWAMRHARRDLAIGRQYKAMLAAAANDNDGADQVTLVDGDARVPIGGVARRREELALPPDEMFRHVRSPALALSGERDLNVPPEHAQRIVEVLAKNGNGSAKAVVIPGVDHSFQTTPGDEDERFRERYSLASFARPYDQRLYAEMLLWLRKHAPTRSAGHSAAEVAEVLGASRAEQPTVRPGTEINSTARSAPEHAPKSETTPARTVLSPGVEIIADVTDAASTAGVETLEGRIGPLLLAEGCQAHFIDMPGGMFVEEHPHSTESIIYTVRGQWVLCSRGRRQLMKPGSLFRFTAGTPTGYEVPFADSAFILIFKGDRVTKVEAEFIEYLRGMAARLDAEHKKGTAFKLSELPADHPARAFARRVNPKFEPK